MIRENLSPTHLFDELQRRPPAAMDPWQRRSPKAVTTSGERKRVRIVSWRKDDKAVMKIVVRDDNSAHTPRERTITLKSFVLSYEPGDEILENYEHICRAKRVQPARPRQAGVRGRDPRIQQGLAAVKRSKRLRNSRVTVRR